MYHYTEVIKVPKVWLIDYRSSLAASLWKKEVGESKNNFTKETKSYQNECTGLIHTYTHTHTHRERERERERERKREGEASIFVSAYAGVSGLTILIDYRASRMAEPPPKKMRGTHETTDSNSSELQLQDTASIDGNDSDGFGDIDSCASGNLYQYMSDSEDDADVAMEARIRNVASQLNFATIRKLENTETNNTMQSDEDEEESTDDRGLLWSDEHDHDNCSVGVLADAGKQFLQQIAKVQELLAVEDVDAVISVLVHFRFQTGMIELRLSEDGGKDRIQRESGVTFCKVERPKGLLDMDPFTLDENIPYRKCDALPCGHFLSNKSWEDYLTTQMVQPGCIQLRCPVCETERIRRGMVRLHCGEKPLQNYDRFLLDAFVAAVSEIKYCPNPRCPSLVFAKDTDKSSSVVCQCGYVYCFGCMNDVHRPVSCKLARKWLKDFIVDYTPAWLESNTKQCPQCNQPIEKNQGCDHMFCDPKAGGCAKRFNWSSASATRVADTPTDFVGKDHFVYAEKFVDFNKKERLARLSLEENLRLEKNWAAKQRHKMVTCLSEASRVVGKGHRIIKWTYVYDFHKDADDRSSALVADWRQRLEESVHLLQSKIKHCELKGFLEGSVRRSTFERQLAEIKTEIERTSALMKNTCEGIEQDAAYQA